jgi:hypothetical protein
LYWQPGVSRFRPFPSATRLPDLLRKALCFQPQPLPEGDPVFLVREAEQRVLRYTNAGMIKKIGQTDEILQFVRSGKKHTGHPPAELVFDSQLTASQKLSELEGISFITLRRPSDTRLRDTRNHLAAAELDRYWGPNENFVLVSRLIRPQS